MMATDPWFRAFHEGRSLQVPEYYHWRYEQRLGRYAELVPRAERVPEHEAPSLSPCAPTPTPSPDHGSLTSRPRGKPPLMIPALASS